MKNVAEFTLIGRIGNISPGGGVTRLSTASNYRRKEKDGSWADDPHWNQVVVFNEGARGDIAEHVRQGDLVMARGRVRQSSYKQTAKPATASISSAPTSACSPPNSRRVPRKTPPDAPCAPAGVRLRCVRPPGRSRSPPSAGPAFSLQRIRTRT